jgi:hypothetical protein
VFGGLIRRADSKNETKIPLLGDIPYLGAAFRYRTQQQERREIIFIVTPHIIRTDADLARVSAEAARKMSWSKKEVFDIHSHGAAVLSGHNPYLPPPGHPDYCPPGHPGAGHLLTTPPIGFPPPTGVLPGGLQPDGVPVSPTAPVVPYAPGTSVPLPYPQPAPDGVLPGGLQLDGAAAPTAPAQPAAPSGQQLPIQLPTGYPSVVAPPGPMPSQPVAATAQPQPGVGPAGMWVYHPQQSPVTPVPQAANPQNVYPPQAPTGSSAKPAKEGEKSWTFSR